MRRIISAALAVLVSTAMFAQAQITTKKMRIADFKDKTTKVVLTGSTMFDGIYQQKVKAAWTVSPYEFCTQADFEALKSNPDYYFLVVVSGKFRKESEPGIEMLTLMKGGVGSEEGVDGMFDIVSVPLRPIGGSGGREYAMLPALLNIIQQNTLDSMETDVSGYMGLGNYMINLPKTKDMEIVFADGDIAPQVSVGSRNLYLRDGMISMEDSDDVDDLMREGVAGKVVSYTVAPEGAKPGSYCFKMLIGTEDNTLYFFKKHKISAKFGAGFLEEDLKKIASVRK